MLIEDQVFGPVNVSIRYAPLSADDEAEAEGWHIIVYATFGKESYVKRALVSGVSGNFVYLEIGHRIGVALREIRDAFKRLGESTC